MEIECADEIDYAELCALESAFRFMVGYPNWNFDNDMLNVAELTGLDPDLVYLMHRVLFAPAVVFVATGKTI